MKHHINVLYGAVVLLLVLQIIGIVFTTSQTARILASQQKLDNELNEEIQEVRRENQFNVDEIVRSLSEQRDDFDKEIDLLKATQEDFSGVIGDSVKKVVSVLTDSSAGSGFFVDSQGHVLTNYHVIADGSFIRVHVFDGRTFSAELVGFDEFTDVALLKIDEGFDYFEFEDSDKTAVGEKVIAIGNPLGLSFTVTEGIVSAVNRVGPNGLAAYVQTDVSLNRGNSGGPLINREGNVVGVNNFKVGDATNLGFALESNIASDVVNQIMLNSQSLGEV